MTDRRAGFGPAKAAMIVPLKARGTIIGVVVFASLGSNRRYGPRTCCWPRTSPTAPRSRSTTRASTRTSGAVARALQVGLLPQQLPSSAGVDLAARYRPAGDGSLIGGDFYDVLPRADGGVDLVIGDVTGKGARAAALTAQVRHTLRTAARYEDSPAGCWTSSTAR